MLYLPVEIQSIRHEKVTTQSSHRVQKPVTQNNKQNMYLWCY
jgi:hypothetical protein